MNTITDMRERIREFCTTYGNQALLEARTGYHRHTIRSAITARRGTRADILDGLVRAIEEIEAEAEGNGGMTRCAA